MAYFRNVSQSSVQFKCEVFLNENKWNSSNM